MRHFVPPKKAAAAPPAAPAPAGPEPAFALFDCIFFKGLQRGQAREGTLALRGRTAALHRLGLEEVARDRLPAKAADALHAAYVAAAQGQPGTRLWDTEPPQMTVGSMHVEIEDDTAAAMAPEDWALRQQVQQQAQLQVGPGLPACSLCQLWPANSTCTVLQSRKRSRPYELAAPALVADNIGKWHDTALAMAVLRCGIATESTACNSHNLPSGAGAKLLRRMGWQDGQGLGRSQQGATAPIQQTVRCSKVGLGASTWHQPPPGQVQLQPGFGWRRHRSSSISVAGSYSVPASCQQPSGHLCRSCYTMWPTSRGTQHSCAPPPSPHGSATPALSIVASTVR